MFKCFCLGLLILIYSSAVNAQDIKFSDKERMEKGNQIIENARKGIGVNDLITNLATFRLLTKSLSDLKEVEVTNTKEINVLFPDKILYVYSTATPFESKSTSIWNGEKYKKLSEFATPDGQRTVRDVTNQQPSGNLEKFVKDKEILEKFKMAMAIDPKMRMNDNLWSEIFPLILAHPFERQAEFKYIGKAQAANGEANIVETTSASGRLIHLFFDSKTNQLLMMTEKYKSFDGDYETKYYYSNRESVSGVLIPKKIKVEHKYTATGKEAKVTNTYIEIVEFKVNPKFKSNLFDVK